MVKVGKLVQLSNKLALSVVVSALNVTLVRLAQLLKTPLLTAVIVFGIVILVRPDCINACVSSVLRVLGMVKLVSFVHKINV